MHSQARAHWHTARWGNLSRFRTSLSLYPPLSLRRNFNQLLPPGGRSSRAPQLRLGALV